MITVKCSAGLSNRLRLIFSFRKALDINEGEKEKLKVLWPINCACTNTFHSCFEDIHNIVFDYYDYVDKTKKCDYEGCSYLKHYTPKEYPHLYKYLVLNNQLLTEVNNTIKLLKEKYNAIHIRGTDMLEIKNFSMNKKDISNFILDSAFPVYLATDDPSIQEHYQNLYSTKIITYKNISNDTISLRKTTLQHSVIDMFMCIKSNIFFPCNFSSFSDLIKYKRLEYV